MTIEIHTPELESLILERMRMGGFHNLEDALKTGPVAGPTPPTELKNRSGADLIAAMQLSPYREIEIEPARHQMPVRDIAF
jgi:hypothetical protein